MIFIIICINVKLNGEKVNNLVMKNDFYFLSDKFVLNFKCLFLWIFFVVCFYFLKVICDCYFIIIEYFGIFFF